VHFLSLDADRAYPKKTFNIHEVAQAYEIDGKDSSTPGAAPFALSRHCMTSGFYIFWLKKISPGLG
jgi:hypothetical protein